MLEVFLSGGYWLEAQCNDAGPTASSERRRRGHPVANAYRNLWGRLAFGLGAWPPRVLLLLMPPCLPALRSFSWGGLLLGFGLGGLSDWWVSGRDGSIKTLRRRGSGVAAASYDGSGEVRFGWGLLTPWHGGRQTPPRPELNACIAVLSRIAEVSSVSL